MPDINQLNNWLSQLRKQIEEDQRSFFDFRRELGDVLNELHQRIKKLEEAQSGSSNREAVRRESNA